DLVAPDILNADGRRAQGKDDGGLQLEGCPRADESAVLEMDGVVLAEVLDADSTTRQFLDPQVVPRHRGVLDDAAGDPVALGSPAKFQGPRSMLELLALALVGDVNPEHGLGPSDASPGGMP